MAVKRCPSASELQQLVAGDLEAAETARIEAHINDCLVCSQALGSLTEDMPADWQDWWQESHSTDTGRAFLEQLTRYRFKGEIGAGGFGTVYHCHDEVSGSDVAVKIPHGYRVATDQDVDAYLEEARNWARLDHPGIARFLHAERFGGSCYVVSKYVDGVNLKDHILQTRPSPAEAASIVAQVAEALHHVHARRMYHRDIKPSNIVLGFDGRPYLTDFGIALREDQVGSGPRALGSLPYMSPEQARGEGHLVDGRTDIYSLGVVFYEMLTGQRPFRGTASAKLIEQIIARTAPPLRAIREDSDIPQELERICLKALSKRITDRYTTARDLASDLRHWAKNQESGVEHRTRVVPKGLGSFDADDAYFFLKLLPGPRDRNGLPESLRSWKTRIEQTDPDQTFRVAVISGPSGCGKSSLIKAGLLPRLSRNIVSVYLAAGGGSTEARLLGRLRRVCPDLSPELSLAKCIAAIRTGQAVEADVKILIVIDQFEQWLHATGNQQNTELNNALRQCDGRRVQTILSVRDDFHTAVARRMDELEVRLVQGLTFDRVDLFDLQHAWNVLAEFGRAYGRLPDDPGNLSAEDRRFLEDAVAECSDEGVVIPVRLALFAHMLRNKEWNTKTLDQLGGIKGVGTTFLEEEFGQKNPYHGRYQEAAQSVLRALLPERGTEIRTQTRSYDQLREVSGISDDNGDFRALLNLLDTELKLISPTDAEALHAEDEPARVVPSTSQLYQLTHDFLVPSLREWLTRKQRETHRGRAELVLAERSHLWNSMRENKQLPSELEWASILLHVRGSRWSDGDRAMMRTASRRYATRLVGALLVFVAVGLAVWFGEYHENRMTVHHTTNATQAWRVGQVGVALDELRQAREWDSDHSAVRQLLSEMQDQGGVTFVANPDTCAFDVHPDPQTGGELGLDDEPRLLGSDGKRIASGRHIRLAVGHYRVSVYAPTDQYVTNFPLFVDRPKYDIVAGRPVRGNTSGESSNHIRLARQLTLHLTIPDHVPEAYSYIAPGPMWCSGCDAKLLFDDSRSAEMPPETLESPIDARSHDCSADALLEQDTLPYGLLMAKAETTWRDYGAWWGDGNEGLGRQCCEWFLERRTRVAEVTAETREVPRHVKLECWRKSLENQGIDTDSLSDEDILMSVFRDFHVFEQRRSQEFEQHVNQTVLNKSAAHADLPASVGWFTAIAFARTHALINEQEFGQWVGKRIELAAHYSSRLKQLRDTLQQSSALFVATEELPATPLVRNHLTPVEAYDHPRLVLSAYEEWLKTRSFYGWQVPMERILQTQTVNTHSQLGMEPSTWLWGEADISIRNQNSAHRTLVDRYANQIADGHEQPLREHLLKWLQWMIRQEQDEYKRYSDLLTQLRNAGGMASDHIPFDVRYRYGIEQGWDIPTAQEWEKAFRGADSRSYTWGELGQGYAWVNQPSGPLAAAMANSTVKDTSPYGILHMAGNVSEWVRVCEDPLQPLRASDSPVLVSGMPVLTPNDTAWSASFPDRMFLKGGNYAMDARYCRAGFSFSLPKSRLSQPGGPRTPWTGFRVVRRIDRYGVSNFDHED